MVRHAIPCIIDNLVIPPKNTRQRLPMLRVGSAAWYAWLNEADTCSFTYQSPEGTLTARREQRHGCRYWYAYRSQQGHLAKTYLGKSEELTEERLHTAALLLQKEGATRVPPASTLPTTQLAGIARPTNFSVPPLHLLTTKISVPPARPNIVKRTRLVQWMNTAVQGTLTLVVAPAGWGKTTLLTSWYAQSSHKAWPLAWVALDGSDNDPLRFWTYVISALHAIQPAIGQEILAQLYASPSPPIETVLTSLLNALGQLSTESILVLEDYHLITAQPIHDALVYFIEHQPPNMHIIIASRSDPLLPLIRLRARGALSELRAADLRFTADETTTFLVDIMGLALLPAQITALQTRTEGWIAGLQLAALSMQGRADLAGFIDAFTGSHRYIVDYLIEEVLLWQPEHVQDFLLHTCILDRLSGPLCDAVRERDNSQTLLEYVERTNLFLVALDDERRWYRYHHLFAEVLRNRLQQEQPSTIPNLHRRASRWYEQHEQFDAAVTHALEIPDVERAAQLIEQYAQFTNFPSQFQVLLGWLNRLPDALVRTQPSLCLMHAITLMLTYQIEQASARVSDAELCLKKEMPTEQRDCLQSLITAFRANLARLFGDYVRCIPLAHEALRLMPEQDIISLTRMFRPSTIVTAASAYLIDGDMTPPTEQLVTTAVESVHAKKNLPTTIRSISNLSRFYLLQGRLHQAEATNKRILQLVPTHERLRTLLNGADYYILQGELLCEWNQLDSAEQHLVQGLDLVRETMAADAEMITRGYMALARLQQARKESTEAFATLDTFAQLAQESGFSPHLLAHGAALRAQIALEQGDLEAALCWAETNNWSERSEWSYLNERELLTLVRVRIAQGRTYATGHGLSETLVLLEYLLADANAKMRMRSTLEAHLLCALASQVQGNLSLAQSALEQALILAAPEGYIRLFIEEGAPIVALLHQAYVSGIMPGYVATLLAAVGEEEKGLLHISHIHPASPMNTPLEMLTNREREVLHLLIDGATNREIAEYLVLSVNTVKKHIVNLYGKLGVQSRTQAIAKARALE